MRKEVKEDAQNRLMGAIASELGTAMEAYEDSERHGHLSQEELQAEKTMILEMNNQALRVCRFLGFDSYPGVRLNDGSPAITKDSF